MALIHTLIGNVKGPAGAAGQNFEYKKTYASVSAMNNDYSGTDTSVGDYVIIAANDLSDADNGKVYRKGNSSWVYVVQVAGPRGAKGDPGPLCPLVDNFNTTIYGQGALDAALGPEIKTGDTQNNVVTFTSSDVQDSAATSWTSVTPLATGETHTSLMGKISQFAKNIRYLYKLLGSTDISAIGSGTVTDILSALNTNKFDKSHVLNNLTTPASQAGYALDAREGKVLNDNISSLNDAFSHSIGRKTYNCSYTVGAGSEVTINGSQFGINDLEGYVPVGICAFNTRNANVVPCAVQAHAAATGAAVRLKNFGSSSVTTECALTVLYIKSYLNVNL
jgi:hypothetical protein